MSKRSLSAVQLIPTFYEAIKLMYPLFRGNDAQLYHFVIPACLLQAGESGNPVILSELIEKLRIKLSQAGATDYFYSYLPYPMDFLDFIQRVLIF